MPRGKKGAVALATQPPVEVQPLSRRTRLVGVVVALKGVERDLAELRVEVEPQSRNAEALIREACEQVAHGRQALENYQDELEVWD